MKGWKGIAAGVLAEAGVEITTGGLVRVPFRDRDRRIVVHKVFGRDRSWYDPAGVELIPFGIETLPVSPWIAERSGLLVCEGESDALAAREHFPKGDSMLIAWYAIALPGAGVWRHTWRRYLEPFPRVYLLGDGDDPGRRMNRRIAADARWARPVRLPDGDDVRSILQRDGRAGLGPHLAAAGADARLAAALRLATNLDDFEALLAGAEVR